MEKIGGMVGRVLEGLGIQKRVEEYKVIEEWKELVGPYISEHAEPIEITRGRLVVRVESAPMLMEMRMIRGEIIKGITGKLGEGVVREILFISK